VKTELVPLVDTLAALDTGTSARKD
jgi:hypothetical protein